MKVVITNTVLANGGDAAILLAIREQIYRVFGTGTSVVVADSRPDAVRSFYPELELVETLAGQLYGQKRTGLLGKLWGLWRFLNWYLGTWRLSWAARLFFSRPRWAKRLARKEEWHVLHHYASADLVIATGGTYLVDHYWIGQPVFELGVVARLKRPLVLYTQSMGPFQKKRFRKRLKALFEYASLILLRDEKSKQALESLCGPLSQAFVAPDAVIGYQGGKYAGEPEREPVAAISVRNWPYFKRVSPEEGMQRYKQAVARAARYLIEKKNMRVLFISTCQGVEGYTYDDAGVAESIRMMVPEPGRARITVNSEYHHPDALIARLSSCRLVIATRMHMAILSLVARTPVIPIAYEFKTSELVKNTGLTAYLPGIESCDIESVSGDALISYIDLLLNLDEQHSGFFTAFEQEAARVEFAAHRMENVPLKDKRGLG